MKTELLEARNKLYEALPTGNVDAFELIQAINIHLKRLDNIIDKMDTQCVLPNVVGQSEQLNCEHEWKVEAFDCYGMPYEQYCEHCGKKEAI